MNLPAISDRFKRSIISETAMRLAAKHGRLKMYSSQQVADATADANFPAAWTGWAVPLFCTNAEFADYCAATGLTADYRTTREDVLRFLDKPQASSGIAKAAVAGTALAAGAALANQQDEEKKDDTLETLVDAAETLVDAADVVSGIFDALDIF